MAFSHDEDGDLQIVCGAENHSDDDWHVVGVGHLDLDRMQLMSLPTIDPGYAADREGVGGEWKIFPR